MAIIPVGYGPGINFIPPTGGGGGGGDLGDANVWAGATLAAAEEAAGNNLSTGDYFLVSNELFYVYAGGDNLGTHAIPTSIPVSDEKAIEGTPDVYAAFYGVDPVDKGLPGWSYFNSGTPVISIDGDNVILSAPTSSDRAVFGFNGDRPSGPMIMVITNVSGSANNALASRCPQIQVRTSNSNRNVVFRPGTPSPTNPTNAWEISANSGSDNIDNTQVGTETDRIEIYFDPTIASSPVRVRVGGPGTDWQSFAAIFTEFSSSIPLIIDSGREANNQALSLSGIVVAELS